MKVEAETKIGVIILRVTGRVVGDASLDLRSSIRGLLAEVPEDQRPKVVINLQKAPMRC